MRKGAGTLQFGIFLAVILSGCNSPEKSPTVGFPETREFWCESFDGSGVYQTTAYLKGISTSGVVYVEEGLPVSDSLAQAIADEFENIYSVIRNQFAVESDVDGNGRIILLLMDIKDTYEVDGYYVGGYFFGLHELAMDQSNLADMIFMDVVQITPGSDEFYSVVAHEFQHLVNFADSYIREGGKQQDVWINEGLSAAAEYAYMGTFDSSRIGYFNSDPQSSISEGNNFFVWDEGDVLADYSTAYIFFQWLRLQASNGSGIFKDIMNENQYDVRDVVVSASNRIYGGTPTNWYEILRDWYLAIAYGDTSGIYGFYEEFTLNPKSANDTSLTMSLEPGETILRTYTGGSYTPGSVPSDIYYVGIGDIEEQGSDDVRDEIEPYEGTMLLAINGTTNNGTDAVDVELPPSASINSSAKILSTSSIIDRRHVRVGVTYDSPNRGSLKQDGN